MKVSSFKNLKEVIPERYSLTIEETLTRIKNGDVSELVTQIRKCHSKIERDTLKKELPAVTYGGVFEKRSKDGLKKASGFMVIDFDNVDEPITFREDLSLNKYIYSAWISPSGKGVKALVKIPIVNTNDQYASYFNAFKEKCGGIYVDKSGKDISRLCFESYDPGIWVNLDSEIWVEFDSIELERPVISHDFVTVPCTDEDEIVRRLLKWFEKQYNSSERNNSINKLAFAFNLFGVDINTTKSIALRYEQKDFRAYEILRTVDSAYSKRELFGTQQFQDNKKRDFITSFSRGKSIDEVKKKFKEVSSDVIEQIVDSSKDIQFWEDNDGKIRVVHNYYRDYLHNLGFNKILFTNDTKVISFIRKEGKFVREYQPEEIKDFVLRDIENKGEMDVWNTLAGSPKYFNEGYLSMLESKVVDVEKDGVDYALFYFQNTVVKVTVDSIELIDYNDLPKSVWETQVLKRDFVQCDHHNSDFRTFIWNACGRNVENYNSFKSVIGRLLHTYKTTVGNRALIASDDDMSDTPNGGSGKSLLWLSIGKLRKVSEIDGMNFDFSKSFNYQTVPIDTQVLVYDDIDKNFNFQRLFSVITGGLTVEYKSQNAIKLDVTESPQIYITTNYAIKGVGGSFDRRKHEIEFAHHYNSNYSPEDEFGKRFFDEWSDEEWASFDNYMINCLQYFLKNGLVKQSMNKIRDKKLKSETSNDWYNFCISQRFTLNKRYYVAELKELFREENDHYKEFTNKTFRNWITAFASFKMWNISDGKDVKGRFIEFSVGEFNAKSEEAIDSINDDELPF
jgi:hypothetical protein